jgi:hypothetical protein
MGDVDQAFNKYQSTMMMKYNSDPRFKAMSDKHMANAEALGNELDNENGWTFEDNNGSLEAAANQWNTMGLWSVGMTYSKTQKVNAKMMEVAKSAMAFNDDPVYGPWVTKHQEILMGDILVALDKYEKKM